MKYPWAVPGAKVVCVDASIKDPISPRIYYVGTMDGLTEGGTYTIRDVVIDPEEGYLTVRLVEIVRPILPTELGETGFRVGRFRPLHTQESDVALFAHLLTPAPTSPMLPTKELTDQ